MPIQPKIADSSRLERYVADQDGEPIRVLGFLDADSGNVTETTLAASSNVTITTLVKGGIYLLTVIPTAIAGFDVLKISLQHPSTATQKLSLCSQSGMIQFVFKARDTSLKIATLATSVGITYSLFRLA